MGWGKGYGNYRSDEQRECPVLFFYFRPIPLVIIISIFLGVFWGGIRYTLHVFFVRGVIKYCKIIVKIGLLTYNKEFYLFSIRMVFFVEKNVLKVIVWEIFVRGGVRCDASNRLLRNTSHDDPMWVMRSFVHLGDIHELSSLTRIHVVSTASDPKIPPKFRNKKPQIL